MSSPDDVTGGPAEQQRIGNAEREAAVSALKQHHAAGRIDALEYEDRSVAVSKARVWAELTQLFTDLPEPRPTPGSVAATSGPAPLPTTGPSVHTPVPAKRGPLLPEPWSSTVMSLTPLAAIILFFVTGDWEWFLMIPIGGIVIYGPEGRNESDRHRHHRNRNRRPDRD
jgi:hypothetical protein